MAVLQNISVAMIGARISVARSWASGGADLGSIANAISQDDYDNEMLREEDAAIGADHARRQAS
jgi:hypothetical protein